MDPPEPTEQSPPSYLTATTYKNDNAKSTAAITAGAADVGAAADDAVDSAVAGVTAAGQAVSDTAASVAAQLGLADGATVPVGDDDDDDDDVNPPPTFRPFTRRWVNGSDTQSNIIMVP